MNERKEGGTNGLLLAKNDTLLWRRFDGLVLGVSISYSICIG